MDSHLSTYFDSPEKLAEIPVSDVPALLAQIAAIQSALAARLIDASNSDPQKPESDWEDRLITVDEAATKLCFTSQYMYELVRKGSLPAVRQGKYLRIRLSDLSAWIDRHCEKDIDKQLYHPYSKKDGRQRTSENQAGTRPYSGPDGRSNRRGTKHRGAMGTRRVEDIRTRFPPDSPVGQDKADSKPQE